MVARIELRIGKEGKLYGGFKDFSLTRSMEAISSFFSFTFTDQWTGEGDPWPLNPQDEVRVFIEGYQIVSGFIDVLTGTLNGTSRTYSIQGRDKTSDLIDCSAPIQFGQMAGLTLEQICNKIASGTEVKFIPQAGNWNKGKIAKFQVEEGETMFDAINRAASKVGALLIPDGAGNLFITNVSTGESRGDIVESANGKEFSFTRDFSERFRFYKASGVAKVAKAGEKEMTYTGAPAPKGKNPSLPSALVEDKGVVRDRTLIIKVEGQQDTATITKRCEFEAKVREAKSLVVTCTVEGWIKNDGTPWLINELVSVYAPRLGIANQYGDTFIISETEYVLTPGGGAETRLTLLPKNAFLTEPTIEKKKRDVKGMQWSSEENSEVRVFIPDEEKKRLAH